MTKKRVVCFVDGFNLYHAIRNLKENHLKWVNLWTLSEAFLKRSQEELVDLYFFTAYAPWHEESHLRHIRYVQALEAIGVKIVFGHFKNKKRRCSHCKTEHIGHEEKETDVNIAIHLIDLAYRKAFDKALIITADSDLCPAINLISATFSEIEMSILIPPDRYSIARELRNAVPANKIKKAHLENNLLPAQLIHPQNNHIIHRPIEYKMPDLTSSDYTICPPIVPQMAEVD